MIIAATVSLAGLLLIQLHWFSRAFDVQEEQFTNKVNIALRAVENDVLLINSNQTSLIKPVMQTTSNTFRLDIDLPVNYNILDSLVKIHFRHHQVDIPYQIAMYNRAGDSLLWGKLMDEGFSSGSNLCADRRQEMAANLFEITFPDKNLWLASDMGIWIVSAFTFLIVLLIFSGMIIQGIKQRKLAEIKTDFINNMTHELKTPVTNISIASEVLKQPATFLDEERKQRYAELIYKETQLLKQQIEHVLMLAKLETGELKLNFNLFNINHLIEEVASQIAPRIHQRNGSILLKLTAENAMVKADNFHLLNMLYSLLDNADKYSPGRPEIIIKTSNTSEGISIEISDKGTGIGKESLQHIFDKFYRAPQGNLHDTTGFGLGLSYVKMVVEAHQGKVQVESQHLKGSTFGIILKVA